VVGVIGTEQIFGQRERHREGARQQQDQTFAGFKHGIPLA
jgi:hypothetical protein